MGQLTKEIKESIDKCVLAWLATSNDGQPNVSPKEIFTYFEEDIVLIANIASPQSVKNIKANSLVCLSFVDVFVQKGFQLKGKAQIISQPNPLFAAYEKPLLAMTAGLYPFASITEIKVQSNKIIQAPSYFIFPERSVQERIDSAHVTYNVQAKAKQ